MTVEGDEFAAWVGGCATYALKRAAFYPPPRRAAVPVGRSPATCPPPRSTFFMFLPLGVAPRRPLLVSALTSRPAGFRRATAGRAPRRPGVPSVRLRAFGWVEGCAHVCWERRGGGVVTVRGHIGRAQVSSRAPADLPARRARARVRVPARPFVRPPVRLCSDKEVEEMLAAADTDHDGTIDFSEVYVRRRATFLPHFLLRSQAPLAVYTE